QRHRCFDRRAQVEARRARGGVARHLVAHAGIEDAHVEFHFPCPFLRAACVESNAATCWAACDLLPSSAPRAFLNAVRAAWNSRKMPIAIAMIPPWNAAPAIRNTRPRTISPTGIDLTAFAAAMARGSTVAVLVDRGVWTAGAEVLPRAAL